MEPGFAAFVILAVITAVIGYLAVQHGKIKRQIEESHRPNELENLRVPEAFRTGTAPGAAPETSPRPSFDAEPHESGDPQSHN